MTFDISKLKSISQSTLSTLATKENKTSFTDERFWKPELDNAGNGRAVIRILPSIREGELPWVEQWNYSIRGPGGYYIETSLRTVGQRDPMAEYISTRWKEAQTEADKQILRSAGLSKPRHTFIANILVVNDVAHPENNGKVFLYRFGQQIFEMITDKAKPDAFDESQGNINVTDWDAGCNLRLIVYTKDNKFPSYEKSSFEPQTSIGNDQTIVAIADQMYDLGEFNDPAKLKTYDQLKDRVNRVFQLVDPAANQFESAPRVATTTAAFVAPAAAAQTAPAVVSPVAQSAIAPQQPVVMPVTESAPWDSPTAAAATTAVEADEFDFEELMKDI